MKFLVGDESGIHTHTHTHTDRVKSICPSAISWRGHKKWIPTEMRGKNENGRVAAPENVAIYL